MKLKKCSKICNNLSSFRRTKRVWFVWIVVLALHNMYDQRRYIYWVKLHGVPSLEFSNGITQCSFSRNSNIMMHCLFRVIWRPCQKFSPCLPVISEILYNILNCRHFARTSMYVWCAVSNVGVILLCVLLPKFFLLQNMPQLIPVAVCSILLYRVYLYVSILQ